LNTRNAVTAILIAVFAGLISGYCIGWKVYDRAPASAEGYSAPSTNKDGSITLERKPDSLKAPETAIPAGDKPVRMIKIRVRDTVRVVIHVRDTDVVCPPCDEIPLDFTISTGNDGDHVTARGPDGVVITGTDIPITGKMVKPHPWRVGAALDPFNRRGGVVVCRDIGPLFIGAAGVYGIGGGGGLVMAGVRF
jgi:hypothetical protein